MLLLRLLIRRSRFNPANYLGERSLDTLDEDSKAEQYAVTNTRKQKSGKEYRIPWAAVAGLLPVE
jgi:hypothetical protein